MALRCPTIPPSLPASRARVFSLATSRAVSTAASVAAAARTLPTRSRRREKGVGEVYSRKACGEATAWVSADMERAADTDVDEDRDSERLEVEDEEELE